MALAQNERHTIIKHTLFFRKDDREEVHKMQQFFEEQALKCPKGAFVATRIDGFGQDKVFYETRLVTNETELKKAQEFLVPIGDMIEKMSPMVKPIPPMLENSQIHSYSDPISHSVSINTDNGETGYGFQKFFEKSLLEFFKKYPEVDDRRKFFIEVEVDGNSYHVSLKARPGRLRDESLQFLSKLGKRIEDMKGILPKEFLGSKN
jgi:hypothetical protein